MFQRLNIFLDEHFPTCAGRFGIDAGSAGPRLPCLDLLDAAGLQGGVAPYLDRHPGVDRRAALSVWSMYYFSHLVIGPAVLWLVFRQAVPLAPDALDLRLHPGTGLPETIIVRRPEVRAPAASLDDALQPLVFEHAAPLIARMAQNGLSHRLLWSNFAVYLDWIVRELGDRVDYRLRDEGLALLERPEWNDGRPNPLHGLLTRDGEGSFSRRRLCCLRYLLPGMPGCGMVCPLPSGRQ